MRVAAEGSRGGGERFETMIRGRLFYASEKRSTRLSLDDARFRMGLGEDSFCTVTKKILMIVGQWPYQIRQERVLRITVLVIIILNVYIPQVTISVEFALRPINKV